MTSANPTLADGLPPDGPPSDGQGGAYCDRCGEPAAHPNAAACAAARTLEPPRYCAQCRRRLVVQVTPLGWTARCSAHGPLAS